MKVFNLGRHPYVTLTLSEQLLKPKVSRHGSRHQLNSKVVQKKVCSKKYIWRKKLSASHHNKNLTQSDNFRPNFITFLGYDLIIEKMGKFESPKQINKLTIIMGQI